MPSKSSGSPYEVMERLGEYRPKASVFRKEGITYSAGSLDSTANICEDSILIEKDYGSISKVLTTNY